MQDLRGGKCVGVTHTAAAGQGPCADWELSSLEINTMQHAQAAMALTLLTFT